ncbi:MAG: aminopeptidase P family protein [Alphaproteobacteria bacterium]|nr:aminopeptidase P family protein [Alphaproteobacteria bacterium SS10]
MTATDLKPLLSAVKASGADTLTEVGLESWLNGLAAVPKRSGEDQPGERYAALLERLDDGQADAVMAAVEARRLPPPTEQPPSFDQQAARLKALRLAMKTARVNAFIIPRADRFQGEQVPPGDERLAWLTGFSGSAGLAVVTADAGAVIVDGRYTLQVRQQVNGDLYDFPNYGQDALGDWLGEALSKGDTVGFDPWLHTDAGYRRLEKSLGAKGIKLKALDQNPIDGVWQAEPSGQPQAPLGTVLPHAQSFAGEGAADKRERLADRLQEQGLAGQLLCQPDGIAWLLNIRGRDVPNAPLPLSFAMLSADGAVDLFCDRRKLPGQTRSHLGNAVTVHDPDHLPDWLAGFVKRAKGRGIGLAAGSTPQRLIEVLSAADAKLVRGYDHVELAKAHKNSTEQQGMRNAHLRDGVAVTRFLAWLDRTAPKGDVTELQVVEKLRECRRSVDGYLDDSFDAIAGAGPNGAIVHYRVTPETDAKLTDGSLFLLDSGGQYADGTTDITRTVAIGRPSPQMCLHYTLVLQAHLAVAMARFPKGTNGAALDALARQPLWVRGLDFDHGTGHGVGSYLCVHEGPHRISKASHDFSLEPGVILSNEPGYYREGEYGIRIENLVIVQPRPLPGDEREMLGFETLTLAPFDRRLIIGAMLSGEEQAWIEAYHNRVYDMLSPLLEEETRQWLEQATQPV